MGRTRWVPWVIIATAVSLPILISALPAIFGASRGKSYEFPRVRIDATVRPDGSLDLVEQRTFDFDGAFSFAYFTIAWPFDRIEDFSVSEGELPLPATVEPYQADGFRARWSFAAEDERRTFTISYRARCAVTVYQDAAHLLWQFIGTGWDQPTESALVLVHLPDAARKAKPGLRSAEECPAKPQHQPIQTVPLGPGETRAWGHGPLNGEVTIVDPRTVELDVSEVPAFTFVEGSILFPPEAVPFAFQVPIAHREAILASESVLAEAANAARREAIEQERRDATGRRIVVVLMAAIPLVFLALVVTARRGDRVPGVPETLQEPPEEIHPMDLARMWGEARGRVSPQTLYRTQMLHLARRRVIDVQAVGRVSDPEDFRVALRRMPKRGLDREFAEFLFPDGQADPVSLRTLKATGKRKTELREWWKEATDMTTGGLARMRTGLRWEAVGTTLVGVTGILLGIGGTEFLGGPLALALVPISLVGLIVAQILIRPRLAPRFRERIALWRAFRRFLKDFSSLSDAPALAVVIWENYLVYATALEVAGRVEKQVKALVPAEELPGPWPGAPAGVQGLLWAHSFHSIPAHTAAAAVSSSPSFSGGVGSFSSGGGFGGGFSGGGGGGGGGTGGGAG